jgi:CRP/FNR family transcriptional regulator, cyclic AMP receptor protein
MENDESLHAVLEYCDGLPEERHAAGDVILPEGRGTGRMYILKRGAIEILHEGVTVAAVDEPGAILGEMSALLGTGHTATVRAASDASLYRIDNARQFLKQRPEIGSHVAVILARRLSDATIYLSDYKRQFAGSPDHFPLVDEVLEILVQRQSKKKSRSARQR